MLDQTAFINQAAREYQSDLGFKIYADALVLRLRARELALPSDTLSCFPLLMGSGEALGKVLLEGYQHACGDRPARPQPLMGSAQRRRLGGL